MEHPDDHTIGEPLFLIYYTNIFYLRVQLTSYLISEVKISIVNQNVFMIVFQYWSGYNLKLMVHCFAIIP